MYKNVIFDVGGVLINFQPRDFLLDHFCNEAVEERVYAITFGSKEWEQLDAGLITRGEANRIFLQKARAQECEFEVATVIEDWVQMLTTRQKTVNIVNALKQNGYHVYYLTNMPSDTLEMLKRRPFWRLFDGGVASCDVGLNKPDTRIYRALMAHYHLVYGETVFIDDNKINAQAAYDVGLTGILYKGNKSLVRALHSCGITLV